ncbi:DNA polymerase IV [Acinetobacter larvae]|uniref:DNA polymerase IV n=1 Tax=Acinetobacter larvae TaxID=1789224 RepID=A0A1B2M4A4_9GAMM|nr:DNA polymerase IV [Acinetobacter larvae]AOA60040.1 DNA polymerase IV [Acinetobacter larvae]
MRRIIHIDMDAFYASVELREHPELLQQPVVISSQHPRAVVAAASYPAREFGIRSAMSMAQARKRCPHVVVIEPNFDKYRAVSQQIHKIFQRYSDCIEPLSLDEAYLDVSDCLATRGSATAIAMQIRADIWAETGLTASAGVAPNKFLAKIASDWNKPNGIFVVKPHHIADFIRHLPLNKIPGVGRVTFAKLKALQLETLGDLQQHDVLFLEHYFGKYGRQLYLYARGIDERPVEAYRQRQQISKETTFDGDLSLAECYPYCPALIDSIWHSLQQKQLQAYGVSIKLKQKNFQTIQHSKSFKQPLQQLSELELAVTQLFTELQVDPQQQYRLVGIGVYQLQAKQNQAQLALW